MDTLDAYMCCVAAREAGARMRVFDWDKAADIINERGIKNAAAGLQADLEWTAGVILEGGKPTKPDYCYLASLWAVPVLVNMDTDTWEEIPCYVMDDETEYDEDTKWPKSALEKLEKGSAS